MSKITKLIHNVILVQILILVSCKQKVDFQSIEFDRGIDVMESISQNINPDSQYSYWAFLRSRTGASSARILNDYGVLSDSSLVELRNNTDGFLKVNGHHADRSYNIIAIQNGKIIRINNKTSLLKFIGEIDTMEEALLITKIDGFRIDYCNEEASSFRKVKNIYEFLLTKHELNSGADDLSIIQEIQYYVTVDSNGILKSESKGIYCIGSDECYCY